MAGFFKTMDKIRPVYDVIYQIALFICKLLLIGDILITTLAVVGRYIPWIPNPSWTQETILTFMAYMAVLSAALAIRRNAHIRMTALDNYLPQKIVMFLDILADVFVLILAFVMLIVGWSYARKIGATGTFISMPWLSKFWQYFPVPLAGFFMIIFELEALYNHIRKIFLGEEAKS